MKARVLQSCLSLSWGGLEMVAYETAVRLQAQSGREVLCAVLPGSPLQRKLHESGVATLELTPWSKYFSPFTVFQLRRAFRQQGTQTVLVQQLRDLWYLVPALLGLRVRLVGVAHMFIGVNKRDILHRWLYRRLFRLVALTEIQKQNLLSHLPLRPEQIVVLPNTVDTSRFSPARADRSLRAQFTLDSNTLFIGVVSRLDVQKGLLEVVTAAAKLAEWRIPFRIAIVGRETVGEDFKLRLEEEITRRGVGDFVRLLGHRSDIETVMASFDVLLMSSPAETFGRVVIEAMASSVTVVAVSGGGVPDVVDDGVTGLLVPPGDSDAMARALRRCFENPALRRTMAVAGLEKVRRVYSSTVVDGAFDQLIDL